MSTARCRAMPNQTRVHMWLRRRLKIMNSSSCRGRHVGEYCLRRSGRLIRYLQPVGVIDWFTRHALAPVSTAMIMTSMIWTVAAWWRSILWVGFVINATTDSFSWKCNSSEISTAGGLCLRSERIIAGTIAGSMHKLRRGELSRWVASQSWSFSAFVSIIGRVRVASCPSVHGALVSKAFALFPSRPRCFGHTQCFLASVICVCSGLNMRIHLVALAILWNDYWADL